MALKCLTHNVKLTQSADGSRRLEGVWGESGQCYLTTEKEPKEGQQGKCKIEAV